MLVDLFRAAPALAFDSLRVNGIDVPATAARLLESTFPVTSPDYHVDLAVACDDALGNPSLVVLVEVQLDVDADKQRSWPLYQGAARARFKCDACVLVVAIEQRVAAWASAPVPLGPGGSVFQAVVLGPAQLGLPSLTPTPETALLSALAHGAHDPDRVRAAVASIAELGEDGRARAYFDLLRYHLGAALDRALEAIMATSEHKYLSDFARKYYDAGREEGIAEERARGAIAHARTALLTVLAGRDIALSEALRARIDACADLATLDAWLVRAVRAAYAAEIFAD